MKRIIFAFVAMISTFSLYSQDALLLYRTNARLPLYFKLKDIAISHTETTQNISVKDGNMEFSTLALDIDSVVLINTDTLYNVKVANLYCPDDNHPHAIDLCLPSGTKWACCNVEASSPEDYGGYYAWGETEEKEVYNDVTYKYASGVDEDGDGWYDDYHGNTATSGGVWQHIGNDIAGTQYDVAHVEWGGSWRMPSVNQIKELLDNCTRTWTLQNEVEGTLVTGPNGNSIFLPAAGDRMNDDRGYEGEASYFWSSIISNYEDLACYLVIISGLWNWGVGGRRPIGFSVRPVCP